MLGINFKSPALVASGVVDAMVDKMKRKKNFDFKLFIIYFVSSKRAENTTNTPWFQPK